MVAIKYNITIEQGADFNLSMTYNNDAGAPIDLTGYTAEMQIRNTYNTAILISLTTENGRIVLGDALGTIVIALTPEETANLDFSDALYDLELINGTSTDRFIEGTVFLSKEVTR